MLSGLCTSIYCPIGHTASIDLFVYARGGAIEVPWRIMTMIREFTDKFCVLVPYKAFSATTLLALGADEIVMDEKLSLARSIHRLHTKRLERLEQWFNEPSRLRM
jgi:hypothetical protein